LRVYVINFDTGVPMKAEIIPLEPDPGNAGVGSGRKKYIGHILSKVKGYGLFVSGKQEQYG